METKLPTTLSWSMAQHVFKMLKRSTRKSITAFEQLVAVGAEDLCRGLVQGAVANLLIDRCAMLKMRIDRDERFWSKSITSLRLGRGYPVPE